MAKQANGGKEPEPNPAAGAAKPEAPPPAGAKKPAPPEDGMKPGHGLDS